MQLILETENTTVGLKETMSSLENDVVAVKNIANDININMLNGNKENIQDQENIVEAKSSGEDKEIEKGITPPSADAEDNSKENPINGESAASAENVNEDKKPETEHTQEKQTLSNDNKSGILNNPVENIDENNKREPEHLEEKQSLSNENNVEILNNPVETANENHTPKTELSEEKLSLSKDNNVEIVNPIETVNEKNKPEKRFSEEKQTLSNETNGEIVNNPDETVNENNTLETELSKEKQSFSNENDCVGMNNSDFINITERNNFFDTVNSSETVNSPDIDTQKDSAEDIKDKEILSDNLETVPVASDSNPSHCDVENLPDVKNQDCFDKIVKVTTKGSCATSNEKEAGTTDECPIQQTNLHESNDSVRDVQLVTNPINTIDPEKRPKDDPNLGTPNDKLETIFNETEMEIDISKTDEMSSEKDKKIEPMDCENSKPTTEAQIIVDCEDSKPVVDVKNMECQVKISPEVVNENSFIPSDIANDGCELKNSAEKLTVAETTEQIIDENKSPVPSEITMEYDESLNVHKTEANYGCELKSSTEKLSGSVKETKEQKIDENKTPIPSEITMECDESISVHKTEASSTTKTVEYENTFIDNSKAESNKNNCENMECMDISDCSKDKEKSNILEMDKSTTEVIKKDMTLDVSATKESQLDTGSINKMTEDNNAHKSDMIELDKSSGDDVLVVEEEKVEKDDLSEQKKSLPKMSPLKLKLSNTLNILSDDEDEPTTDESKSPVEPKTQEGQNPLMEAPLAKSTEEIKSCKDINDKNCINLDDDDDIMLIDEDTTTNEKTIDIKKFEPATKVNEEKTEEESKVEEENKQEIKESNFNVTEPVVNIPEVPAETPEIAERKSTPVENETKKPVKGSLLPDNLFKNYRKNIADMTRDELEEFCILKIVESIIDRSDLNEIRTKLKTMAQTIEEYKKKAMVLMKQNRDLKVILTSVQEEQKKGGNTAITPLKITRSVGMQVLMTDKVVRKRGPQPGTSPAAPNNRQARNTNQKQQQVPVAPANNNQQIPVPRLVPAAPNNTVNRASVVNQSPVKVQLPKPSSPMPNGVKNSPPAGKPEKRTHSKMLTVDLTDDEPPPPKAAKLPSSPPVRLVPSQSLMAAPRPQLAPNVNNSPRKVYIPISAGQGGNVRPGTIMLKSVPGPRARGPMGPMVRIPQNSVRMGRVHNGRHPAPLPDVVKQYQSPNWKALPPAPDLKLSKVENGIVISWKIEGYQEDSYEEIASYQLYAYQETSAPPNTSLWKKIGDVKALPLPMACTLTQFMAGYKYYFAVRAVDVKSRLGPFSLPGSILLLNKM